MSSRKQAQTRNKRYRKQQAGMVFELAYTENGRPALNDDGTQIHRQRPNRALRRRVAADQRRMK